MRRIPSNSPCRLALVACVLAFTCDGAHAAERITLTTGFSIDCLRHEPAGNHLRLILAAGTPTADQNYMDIAPTAVVSIEPVPDVISPVASRTATIPEPDHLSATDLHPLLERAGQVHRVDADLLASVVHAESNGRTHAISRTGAQGLMQLMPATATELGVTNAFIPEQNVNGGSAYLDHLLTRYHDNIALALAAYNAGPAAVDRFHGIPPYRETRAYVTRVILEFNRRKLALARQPLAAPAVAAAALHAGLR